MSGPPVPLHQVGLFYDSGPMLCLGTSSKLRPAFDRQFRSPMSIAAAVHVEVKRISNEPLRNGHHPSKRARKLAAQSALRAYEAEFSAAASRPEPLPTMLVELEASMVEPGQNATKNRGECESIYHAHVTNQGLVTNDSGATRSSRAARVRTVSFVDINRHLLTIDRRLNRDDVATELIRIARSGIDIGDRVRSALDL